MSDYHILEMALDQKTINVVFHIKIPAVGESSAGVQWRDAVVKSLGGTAQIKSVLPDLQKAENDLLVTGGLIEIPQTIRFTAINITNVQRKAEVEQAFTLRKNKVLGDKQIELAWIGHSGDVGG